MSDEICTLQSSCIKGNLYMSWPADISTFDIDLSEQIVALQFKTMRRVALARESTSAQPGEIEYDSWFGLSDREEK